MTESTSGQAEAYQLTAFRDGAAIFASAREVVSVCGADSRSFLQSLVSQDVSQLAAGSAVDALLLQPQGKLIAAMRMFVVDEEHWLLVCDAAIASPLLEGLARFKIRVKVDLELRADLVVLCVRGPRALEVSQYAARSQSRMVDHGVVIVADWDGTAGIDWIGPRALLDSAQHEMLALGATAVSDAAYETARIEAGVLVQGADIDDRTIAQEAQLDLNAVSFTKGCFVGQELVCRIDSRGHVNRFVRVVRAIDESTRFSVGSVVMYDDATVGEVTSAAPLAAVGLATIRRTVEPSAEVVVATASAVVEPRLPSERTNSPHRR